MAAQDGSARTAPNEGPVRNVFASRWRGDVSLRLLFWRDVIIVGTAINVATSVASLAMLAAKVPLAAVLCVFFAPLPYNVFLTVAVWRQAEKRGGVQAFFYQLGVTLWLITATVI